MKKTCNSKNCDKRSSVGIIGLGYVGLPLAREFVRGGCEVYGFDINPDAVKRINSGKSPLKHIPDEHIAEMTKSGRFRATTDATLMDKPDVLILCVPTPLTASREPDMYYVEESCRTVAKSLRKGQLVVLESTTYPGTTNEVMKPILEASGLKAGKDFYMAYSPEREDPGNAHYNTRTIPKVVGAIDKPSLDFAMSVYKHAIDTLIPVDSCETAEAIKIVENVYRCVNIAMVNELKQVFDRMGIDVWEVIRGASSKPFGYQPFYPGPGLGGHCIPIDPFYLTWKARQFGMPTRFIELAGEINTAMPHYVIQRTMEALNEQKKSLKGSKVLVLGLAYKKDIDDIRESPSLELIELLKEKGAKVDYNDPFIPATKKTREYNLQMKSVPLTPANISKYDCVLIATAHSCYDMNMIVKNAKLIVDSRNACDAVKGSKKNVVKA
ncbi:MAG: nucleotide sugar dehydrogenase [Sedimentisphaerales bacterium]|nr:nucleotide sugar dehydrogenase [Sedimentisphaerales bacterium]MBN2843248.1 nucleotide sugar dehydrogenase [Sedimentisphaerales bacterium]